MIQITKNKRVIIAVIVVCVLVAGYILTRPSTKKFAVANIEFKMVRVKGGTFLMGLNPNLRKEFIHQDSLLKLDVHTFYLGQTEVTQELWKAVMGENPSERQEPKAPVNQISVKDCEKFIAKLNKLTGQKFRLPTEAEWEFAAKGGNKSKGKIYAGGGDAEHVGWIGANSEGMYHEVAKKKANELGLYDMTGNVSEYCWDWLATRNDDGEIVLTHNAARGGAYYHNAKQCEVTNHEYIATNAPSYCGLRLAMDAE